MLKTVNTIDVKISGLKILSKIGEGGMSKVYLAEQISLKRKVAVKVMRLEMSDSDLDVQRFKHEAKTIAQLNHPNIINIYNIGQTSNGEVFFTMPYLNHGDFSNYIIENELEFIQLLQSICNGLSFAHDRGVVHRDIKPENLLFDEFGNVRIADFGIAITKNGTRMTKEHQIVGSAQYMSPEQARSLKVDIHTDIYSLGIVIYERLTGKVPFDSDESISILVDHVSAEPPKLPTKMRHWQKIIDKCLAKDPSNRFQSMVELKIALNKVPTNTIQRTNSTINNVLSGSFGKHLRWFIPSLLILMALSYTLKDSLNPKENGSKSNLPVIATNQTTSNSNVTNIKPKTTQNNPSNQLAKGNKPNNSNNNTESSLSIDEIKQKIAMQNSSYDTSFFVPTQEQLLQQEIQDLLDKASKNIKGFQLSRPKSNNATDQLLQVLKLSPNNTNAIAGIHKIGQKYFRLIENAIKKDDINTAIKHAKSVKVFNNKTNNINSQFEIQKNAIIKSIAAIDLSSADVSTERIKTIIRIVKIFSPEDELISQYSDLIKLKNGPQIGEKLLDEMGIETILITKNLAATTSEITVESYTEFAISTNRTARKCKHQAGGLGSFFNTFTWSKPLFPQKLNHPVVCLSQADAQAYSEWLSQQTENRYRLPSKQEWLLLAAVSNNSFSACETANTAGTESKKARNKNKNYACDDKFEYTAPVASFTVNELGLYDIQGNVSEWLHCSEKSCLSPTAMGSSWYNGKKTNKLQMSEVYKTNIGYTHIGFRLVRDL